MRTRILAAAVALVAAASLAGCSTPAPPPASSTIPMPSISPLPPISIPQVGDVVYSDELAIKVLRSSSCDQEACTIRMRISNTSSSDQVLGLDNFALLGNDGPVPPSAIYRGDRPALPFSEGQSEITLAGNESGVSVGLSFPPDTDMLLLRIIDEAGEYKVVDLV